MLKNEAVITRVYETTNREMVLSFKIKFGDLTLEQKEKLRELCMDKTPVALSVAEFQPEYIDQSGDEVH